MSQLGTSWMFLIRVNCKIAITTVELVLRVIVFHVITYFAMLYMNYPRCGHCAFLASFISECTLMLVPLLEKVLHKESVVVEEIKEVKLRSRRAQFVYDRNYNRIGLQPQGHAPSRLPVKKLRRLLLKRRKVRVSVWKGIRKKIISDYSSAFTINSTTTAPTCTLP